MIIKANFLKLDLGIDSEIRNYVFSRRMKSRKWGDVINPMGYRRLKNGSRSTSGVKLSGTCCVIIFKKSVSVGKANFVNFISKMDQCVASFLCFLAAAVAFTFIICIIVQVNNSV